MHPMLANLPWRHLLERAEKIPGDKKHVESILSQSHFVAQFTTAHNPLNSGRKVAYSGKCPSLARNGVLGDEHSSDLRRDFTSHIQSGSHR